MVWVTAPGGNCTFLSQSWYDFTGKTLEMGLGHGWLDAIHPEDRKQCEREFRAAGAERRAFRIEYRVRRADGEWRWAIDAATPRFSSDGFYLGHIGSILDIHERKMSEDREHFLM